jgi:predicted ATPase
MNWKVTMGNPLEVEQVNAVEAVESNVFEIRLLLQDGSEATLRLDGRTLCSLADTVSQYATA